MYCFAGVLSRSMHSEKKDEKDIGLDMVYSGFDCRGEPLRTYQLQVGSHTACITHVIGRVGRCVIRFKWAATQRRVVVGARGRSRALDVEKGELNSFVEA